MTADAQIPDKPVTVLGVPGRLEVVGPDDQLIIHIGATVSDADIERVVRALDDHLGRDRYLLFAGDVALAVLRPSTTPTSDEVNDAPR